LNYCYPKELIREIADNNGQYISDLLTMFSGDENYIFKALEITRKRINTMLYLLKHRPTDLLICVFTEIDRVSHYYWKYSDDINASESMRNAILSIYKETDAVIGQLLQYCNDAFNFIIYSDHGFEKGVLDFYAQAFLIKKGFMHLRKAPLNYTPNGGWFECLKSDGLYIVDWDKTVAYVSSPGSYGININLVNRQNNGIVSEADYGKICNEVINEFRKIKNPLDNSFLFKKVCDKDDVYHGDCIAGASDIILIPQNYGIMVHHKLTDDDMFCLSPEQNGMHSQDGVIIFYGNKFKDIKHIPQNIEKVAPMILEFYKIKIPNYMKGSKSKKQLCKSETDELTSYRKEDEESIVSRLKMLGYY
jgi:predicted AlkP superfamily phosphohydrolase/phosphomutase